MKRKTIYIDPLDNPRASPTRQAYITRDKPGRHEAALWKRYFWVCMNCTHWEVFQWEDAVTGKMSEAQCWTCGSKDVKRYSKRPLPVPNNALRKLGIKKLEAILKSKGIPLP